MAPGPCIEQRLNTSPGIACSGDLSCRVAAATALIAGLLEATGGYWRLLEATGGTQLCVLAAQASLLAHLELACADAVPTLLSHSTYLLVLPACTLLLGLCARAGNARWRRQTLKISCLDISCARQAFCSAASKFRNSSKTASKSPALEPSAPRPVACTNSARRP